MASNKNIATDVIAEYDQVAYQQATSLRVGSLAVMDNIDHHVLQNEARYGSHKIGHSNADRYPSA